MRRARAALCVLLACGLAVIPACSAPPGSPADELLPGPLPAGVVFRAVPDSAPPAPNGTLTLENGDTVSLERLWADRPVVLSFFEAWCTACAQAQARFNAAAERYGDAAVFVAVAAESSAAEAEAYAREGDVPYLVARDTTGELSRAFGVEQAPFTVFLSPGGRLLRGWPAYIEGLEDAIAALLVESMPGADDDAE